EKHPIAGGVFFNDAPGDFRETLWQPAFCRAIFGTRAKSELHLRRIVGGESCCGRDISIGMNSRADRLGDSQIMKHLVLWRVRRFFFGNKSVHQPVTPLRAVANPVRNSCEPGFERDADGIWKKN